MSCEHPQYNIPYKIMIVFPLENWCFPRTWQSCVKEDSYQGTETHDYDAIFDYVDGGSHIYKECLFAFPSKNYIEVCILLYIAGVVIGFHLFTVFFSLQENLISKVCFVTRNEVI